MIISQKTVILPYPGFPEGSVGNQSARQVDAGRIPATFHGPSPGEATPAGGSAAPGAQPGRPSPGEGQPSFRGLFPELVWG